MECGNFEIIGTMFLSPKKCKVSITISVIVAAVLLTLGILYLAMVKDVDPLIKRATAVISGEEKVDYSIEPKLERYGTHWMKGAEIAASVELVYTLHKFSDGGIAGLGWAWLVLWALVLVPIFIKSFTSKTRNDPVAVVLLSIFLSIWACVLPALFLYINLM
jgi:hypothetical protein